MIPKQAMALADEGGFDVEELLEQLILLGAMTYLAKNATDLFDVKTEGNC